MSSSSSADIYDLELRAHHEHLRAAYGIRPGDEVLDVGCGAGLTTREAARAADTTAALATLGDEAAARTVERLRDTLANHHSDEHGVVLDARSWLITARRRSS